MNTKLSSQQCWAVTHYAKNKKILLWCKGLWRVDIGLVPVCLFSEETGVLAWLMGMMCAEMGSLSQTRRLMEILKFML